MGTTIITKNGSGAPAASDLVAGELAVDLTNKRLYTEDSGANILELGSNPSTIVVAGTSTLTGNVTASNDLSVGGNLTVTGNATISGNLTFGNAATDTVTLSADVSSSILPSADDTYDLGASGSEWRDIYIDGTAYLDAISLNGTAITATAAELNILDGVTSTAAELNILDGVTSTAAELNILDGVTSTAAELNILDGVTATTAELNILDGVTSTAAELNILDGVTSTAAELNILDGVTSTAAELNLLDGSTANTVVNSKAVVYGSSGELAGTLSTAAQTNITSVGTLTSLTVDDITIDSSTISDSGNLTFDVGGDIILDADGTQLILRDGGTNFGQLSTDSTPADFIITSMIPDKDIIFKGNDGGSTIEAMRIDMSAGGNVGIGTTSPSTALDVVGDVTITSTDAGAGVGPYLTLFRDSASPADNDQIGQIRFQGEDSAGGATDYTRIVNQIIDTTNGTEDGRMSLNTVVGGSMLGRLNLVPGEAVFNEESADIDFRVESNDNANMLFVDAGNNRIGIGTSSPSMVLDVQGDTDTWIARAYNTGSDANAQGLLVRSDATSAHDALVFGAYADSAYKMVVRSTGNVGIGTASPAGPLHVYNSSAGEQFISSSNSALRLVSTGSANYIQSGTATSSSSAAPLIFTNVGGSGETMRIDANGQVLIGTSTINPQSSSSNEGVQIGEGIIYTGKSGAESLILNRQSSDGDIALFRRDGTTVASLAVSSSDLTIDVSGDIILDADGGDWRFKDAGTSILEISNVSNSAAFYSAYSDADMLFKGNDGGSAITALTLDMSQAGEADFNSALKVAGGIVAHQTNRGVLEYASNVFKIRSYGATSGDGIVTINTGGGGASADAEAMRIDNSGNVQIGSTSSDGRLKIAAASGNSAAAELTLWGNNAGGFGGTNIAKSKIDSVTDGTAYGSILRMYTNDTSNNYQERLRINASGDWMVSNTVANVASGYTGQGGCGWVEADLHFEIATTNDRSSLEIGRNNANDGDIVTLRKQSTIVGSIGVSGGNNLYISGEAADHSGLTFATNQILPSEQGALTDAQESLGNSSNRFSEAYLSSNLKVGGSSSFQFQKSGTHGYINQSDSGSLIFRMGSGYTERMRIDSSGRIGIGGTPNTSWRNDLTDVVLMLGTEATLHSDGGVTTELWNNSYVDNSDDFRNISTRGASRYQQYSGAHKWFTAASATAGSEINSELNTSPKMTLDISGNLLVGKTATTATDAGLVLQGVGMAKFTRTDWSLLLNRIGSSNGEVALFQYDSSTVGNISVTSSATAFNTSSDQRLKDNIVDAPSASDDIDAIQVRSFDWKADGSHQKYGMVAQELVTVAPEAVTQPEDPEEMMGVDYSKLVPMLIKEVQQLRARVAQLEGEN